MAISEILTSVSGDITSAMALAAILLFIIYLICGQCRTLGKWEKYGVKHVTLGKERLVDFRNACHHALRQHGDTVGTQNFGKMYLITKDLDLLKMIFVKDFNNFVDRDMNSTSASHLWKGLIFRGGQDWKRLRQIWSPCFSPGKIKGFLGPVTHSAQNLSNAVQEYSKRGQLIPVKKFSSQFSAEVIAKLAFGLDTDCIGKENDEFTHFSLNLVTNISDIRQFIISILFLFPKVYRFLVQTMKVSLFDAVSKDADVYFESVLHKTIAERKEFVRTGKKLHNDFLQSFVVAKEEGDKAAAAAAKTDSADVGTLKTMTDDELFGQAMLANFAGFETTSTAMQFLFYLLAKYPDTQEKLLEEIESVLQSDLPTFEELGELKYMERVINETLRVFPPGPILTRRALETRTYGNITIPKGAVVVVPLDLIMRDPKNYEDPEKFDPDRFTEEKKAERDPLAFLPFGTGPRRCPGMKLALMELKVALVNLIRKVKFELDEKTKNEELIVKYQIIVKTDKPIMLAAKLRTEPVTL